MLVLESRGKVLFTKGQAAQYVPGDWSLPSKILSTKQVDPAKAAKLLGKSILGRSVRMEEKAMVRHSITHRRIRAYVFHADVGEIRIGFSDQGKMCLTKISRSAALTISSLYKKALLSALSR